MILIAVLEFLKKMIQERRLPFLINFTFGKS
jgi:hypothetical protein